VRRLRPQRGEREREANLLGKKRGKEFFSLRLASINVVPLTTRWDRRELSKIVHWQLQQAKILA